MNILVIGQGGREHALVRALAGSTEVQRIDVLPGNDGMREQAYCHPIDWRDFSAVLDVCRKHKTDFVFIGPEDPAVLGLGDFLREAGMAVVGASQYWAQLEGSKIFAKEFMREFGIPTAPYKIVSSVKEVLDLAGEFTPPYVLKADGLAGGKGVTICENLDELKDAAIKLFEKKVLGEAGRRALLEQYLPGWELSFIFLTNGQGYELLPIAQDHKRLYDHQKGPNTGGMGTMAPLNLPDHLLKAIVDKVVQPTVQGLKSKNHLYHGIVFVGVMITSEGPSVIEYNVRFGDPEAQVILPLLDVDIASLFCDLASGKLRSVRVKEGYCCCVVMAAPGYPENPKKGLVINGNIQMASNHAYFIHAGTKLNPHNQWTTNGGRVLCSMGLGCDANEAIGAAYQQAEKVSWEGMQMRSDIGQYLNLSDSTTARPF